ncbi:MAG: hypothetical protein GWP06_01295 [Actinobacteria bacterium]|nr:hypothetical protein [Actinomycetota bacterium]
MLKLKTRLFSFIIVLWVFNSIMPLMAQQTDPDPNRFLKEIDSFRQWDAKNAIPHHPVLFIGSSSIRKWKTHNSFPDLPVVNRGFGGAHISDMLYFIRDIALKYETPSCIIFYCGDNNIAGGKSAQRVLSDYQKFVRAVHKKFPDVPFIYIPIKPSLSRWALWKQMKKANELIRDYSDKNKLLFYADTATPMIDNDGTPQKDLFVADGLHLNAKGYKLWTKIIAGAIKDAKH